eukprot:gene5877-4197_t
MVMERSSDCICTSDEVVVHLCVFFCCCCLFSSHFFFVVVVMNEDRDSMYVYVRVAHPF